MANTFLSLKREVSVVSHYLAWQWPTADAAVTVAESRLRPRPRNWWFLSSNFRRSS